MLQYRNVPQERTVPSLLDSQIAALPWRPSRTLAEAGREAFVDTLAQRMASVRQALEHASAKPVTLSLWLEPGVPDNALETMYTPGPRAGGNEAAA